MEEACNQERLKRLDCLMVLMARRYRLKRCGPAFDHYRGICQDQVEDEQHACVVEIQRMWRGYRGRLETINEREVQRKQKNQAQQAGVSAVIAVWGQSMYRGEAGRRRAAELRKIGSKERARKYRFEAAGTIQVGWRSFQRRREAAVLAVLAATDKYITETSSTDTGTVSTVTAGEPEGPTITTAAGPIRGPPHPIMASEIQAAQVLGTSDEASLSVASDQTLPRPTSKAIRRHLADEGPNEDGFRRRPSSSREARGGFPPSDDASPSSRRNSRRRRRPSSGGYPRNSTTRWEEMNARQVVAAGTASGSCGVQRPCSPQLMQDASRLVLESEPGFKAAKAVQAAWRGFVVRLALRKRRRATAALRRKRDGKWRQQRGVVGKQVSHIPEDQGAV